MKASTVLESIALYGESEYNRVLAGTLKPYMGETKVLFNPEPSREDEAAFRSGFPLAGSYNEKDDTIRMYEAGESFLLHEAVHAATVYKLSQAKVTSKINLLYWFCRMSGQNLYGLTNLSEFVAEAFSRKEFRDFLKGNNLLDEVIDTSLPYFSLERGY